MKHLFWAVAAALCLVLAVSGTGAAEVEKIYMVGASHIDLAWKWNYDETIHQVCHNTFEDVMDLMSFYENDPRPGNPMFYSQSQAQAYEWMEDFYPDIFRDMVEWKDRGLWEPVGGMWVESDTNLPCGESLVRQVLYGKLYFLERMGVEVRVGWLPDTFGYSAGLPQIFRKAGIDYFACTKVTWNDTHPPDKHMFYWTSPDGSRVLTYVSLGSYNDIPMAGMLDQLEARLETLQPDIPIYLFYIGIGDHGGGVFQIFVDMALRLQEDGYPIVFGPSEAFFEDLAALGVNDVVDDELYLEFHRGTYTSRAEVKERNRESEIALEVLEKFAVLSVPYGGAFPRDDLDAMWKKVLLNQFHDVLPGSGIDLVYEDTRRDYDFVKERSGKRLGEALEAIASSADTESGPLGEPLVVFNPLSWTRSGPVSLPMTADQAAGVGVLDARGAPVLSQWSALDGALLFWAGDVPSMGYSTFYLAPGVVAPLSGGLIAAPDRLENNFLAARVDPATGLLASVLDKQAGGREVIQPGTRANLLQVYREGLDSFPAWDLAHDKYRQAPEELTNTQTFELVESGPLRAVFRTTVSHQGMPMEQQILLWNGLPRLDFRFRVDDWGRVMGRLLKVAFPLELSNRAKHATYDVPYAALTRTHDGSKANWEACGQKWVNVQDDGPGEPYGVALLSGNKYGFDLANDGPGQGLSDGRANILRMSLLKSSTQPLPGAFGLSFGGPVTDQGTFQSAYALYPHHGAWEEAGVVQRAQEFNVPFEVHKTGRHPGRLPARVSFLEVSPATVIATVLKEPERPAGSGELVLRLFETARKDTRVTVTFPTKRIFDAREVDLLERELAGARVVSGTPQGGLSLEVGHDEIVTLRLRTEEKEAAPPVPVTAAGGGCGCSGLDPGVPVSTQAAYATVFWCLLLSVPLLAARRAARQRARGQEEEAEERGEP
jgi:alpha-mannosidase